MQLAISIHTLRVEGDQTLFTFSSPVTPISIHTLRVEGDYETDCCRYGYGVISIHTLRVEGDGSKNFILPALALIFQSTPSAWRVTAKAHKKSARFCSK